MFVGLDAASSESGDAWEGFLTGLGERGLRCPLLVISDGAAGLIGALERTMGAALRQRCLVHRARNVLAKVPKNAQAQVKADYWAIFDVPETIEPGLDAVGYVQKRIDSFEKRWRDAYPAAVRCLLDDRDSLTVYLRFPREHWTRVRHSNFIVIWSPLGRRLRCPTRGVEVPGSAWWTWLSAVVQEAEPAEGRCKLHESSHRPRRVNRGRSSARTTPRSRRWSGIWRI